MDSNHISYDQHIQTCLHSPDHNSLQQHRRTPMQSLQGLSINPRDMSKMDAMLEPPWPMTPVDQSHIGHSSIHDTGFSYCMAGEYPPMPAWDSSTMPLHTSNDELPRGYMQPEIFSSPALDTNSWMSKHEDETMSLDAEMTMMSHYPSEELEKFPMLDVQFSGQHLDTDSFDLDSYDRRRISGSSFTLSTNEGLSEMPSYDDFSATLSEAHSFISDYPPTSNRNSFMSSTPLSPVASPRMTPHGIMRTASRGGASPSPRPNMRSAPYSMDGIQRGPKRWSTGSYAMPQNRRPSPFIYNQSSAFDPLNTRISSRHSSPTLPQNPLQINMANLQNHQQQHPLMLNNSTANYRNSMILPPGHYQEHQHFQTPPTLLSHGMFRMLQSNASPESIGHYADLSDPPDLYASMREEQLSPPESDMNPDDPELIPHEQELRFEGDLYTPRWVRGHGNKREGWCGICKPGRWLVLKNSAFWYDKSFTHGISAATGSAFQEPIETRRMDGNPDVWEGLCGSCTDWVALVSSKKKGTTWFRHAYKCHTHPKIKDAPKRRRESSHARAALAAATSTPKGKVDRPKTPLRTPENVMGESSNASSVKLKRQAFSPVDITLTMI